MTPAFFQDIPNAQTVVAVVYETGRYPEHALRQLVEALRNEGMRLAGVLQHQRQRADRSRCDMELEDIDGGERFALSEDRGGGARGCRMDESCLACVAATVDQSLEKDVELVIINKFGKAEATGEGLRDEIAKAICKETPLLIAVPACNLDAWNAFMGSVPFTLMAEAEFSTWLTRRALYHPCPSPVDKARARPQA